MTTTRRSRNALTVVSSILHSPKVSAPHMDLCAWIVRRKITGQGFAGRSKTQGGTRDRQRNRENPRSRLYSRSKDRRSRRRSTSRKRGGGDERELSDQFETITFESIAVDVIGPQARPANEVFVTVNIDFYSFTSGRTALKAKLETGAQGNILPLRLYRQMYPENLSPEGFPKPGALDHSPTVLTAYGGAKLVHH